MADKNCTARSSMSLMKMERPTFMIHLFTTWQSCIIIAVNHSTTKWLKDWLKHKKSWKNRTIQQSLPHAHVVEKKSV